jgi:isopentenyl diphosphate isomerase/L-lactate dehydrogenase-like FMN-dependent dehydrogenase
MHLYCSGPFAADVERTAGFGNERMGVRDMLDMLREELRVAMILTGCSDAERATPDLLLRN